MVAEHRVTVTDNIKQRTALGWLIAAKGVGAATSANASQYTSIANQIQQLASDAKTLDTAQSDVPHGGSNAIKVRNVALGQVKKSYRAFLLALQTLCDAAPDRAHAEALATGAGVGIKGAITHPKAAFTGKALGNGVVHLFARLPTKKRVRIFWEWQISTDGEKTWVTLATTNDANFVVQNLTPATMPSFRCRSTVKNVASAWSQTVVVHVL